MKTSTLILSAAALTISLNSCDKLKDAADIEIKTDFEESFDVDIQNATEPDGSALFTESASIDLTSGDVADYVDALKEITVTKIEIWPTAYAGTDLAEFSGTVDVGNGYALTIPATNLKTLFDQGGIINLSDQAGAFNYIANQLLNQKSLTYSLRGKVSDVPVTTTLKVKYTLDVVANPLD